MLVRLHDGRIEHHPAQLRRLQGQKSAFPYAFLGQSAEVPVDRIGLAEAFGQVGPRATRAHDLNDTVEKQAVILGRHPAIGGLARQQGGDGRPLAVGDFMTMHRKS
nr:hypothetical protein [Hymenobacter nivis]